MSRIPDWLKEFAWDGTDEEGALKKAEALAALAPKPLNEGTSETWDWDKQDWTDFHQALVFFSARELPVLLEMAKP